MRALSRARLIIACYQCRPKSACSFAQSYQGLHCSPFSRSSLHQDYTYQCTVYPEQSAHSHSLLRVCTGRSNPGRGLIGCIRMSNSVDPDYNAQMCRLICDYTGRRQKGCLLSEHSLFNNPLTPRRILTNICLQH